MTLTLNWPDLRKPLKVIFKKKHVRDLKNLTFPAFGRSYLFGISYLCCWLKWRNENSALINVILIIRINLCASYEVSCFWQILEIQHLKIVYLDKSFCIPLLNYEVFDALVLHVLLFYLVLYWYLSKGFFAIIFFSVKMENLFAAPF